MQFDTDSLICLISRTQLTNHSSFQLVHPAVLLNTMVPYSWTKYSTRTISIFCKILSNSLEIYVKNQTKHTPKIFLTILFSTRRDQYSQNLCKTKHCGISPVIAPIFTFTHICEEWYIINFLQCSMFTHNTKSYSHGQLYKKTVWYLFF